MHNVYRTPLSEFYTFGARHCTALQPRVCGPPETSSSREFEAPFGTCLTCQNWRGRSPFESDGSEMSVGRSARRASAALQAKRANPSEASKRTRSKPRLDQLELRFRRTRTRTRTQLSSKTTREPESSRAATAGPPPTNALLRRFMPRWITPAATQALMG